VVEIQMDDDDDDLKTPPSAKENVRKTAPSTSGTGEGSSTTETATHLDRAVFQEGKTEAFGNTQSDLTPSISNTSSPQFHGDQFPDTISETEKNSDSLGWSSALRDAQAPGWSFKSVGK